MRLPFGVVGLAFGAMLLTSAAPASATPTDGLLDPCTAATVSGAESELFKDMPPGSVGYDEAQALYNEGITAGCQASPLLFCPQCEISKAAFTVFVVRAAKLALIDPAQPTFTDVPTTHAFYKEIETAADAGLTTECAAGKFCPDDPLTRAVGATLVAKGAGLNPVTPASPSYTDVPASDPAFGYIEALSAACVTAGCGAGQFCPKSEMVRAQAAAFVARAFAIGGSKPCPSDAGASDAAPPDGASGAAGEGGSWNDSGIPQVDAGAGTGGGGAGKAGSAEPSDSGGCSLGGGSNAGPWLLVPLLGGWLRRRRAVGPRRSRT